MDAWSELWVAAKTAGPFANLLLLFLLYRVDRERRTERGKNESITREMLTAVNEATSSIKDLASLFQRREK